MVLELNVVTYGTLIKGYAKINDLEKVLEKYEEMLGRGIKEIESTGDHEAKNTLSLDKARCRKKRS